jgi:hypothetical protein
MDVSQLKHSHIYPPDVMADIQTKAQVGHYRIRGFGMLRRRNWATFDDLSFVPCGLTRIPLEGYCEKCSTKTVLGARFAAKPLELDIPIMVAGMSWGALSLNAKAAFARGTAKVGSSNTTGDGGMLQAERENAKNLVYEVLPSRYGINIHDLKRADAIELTMAKSSSSLPAAFATAWMQPKRCRWARMQFTSAPVLLSRSTATLRSILKITRHWVPLWDIVIIVIIVIQENVRSASRRRSPN